MYMFFYILMVVSVSVQESSWVMIGFGEKDQKLMKRGRSQTTCIAPINPPLHCIPNIPLPKATHSKKTLHQGSDSSNWTGSLRSSETDYHPHMQLMQQMNDMPRYGYPYTGEMPMVQQPHHHNTVVQRPRPTSLNLSQQQVPSIQDRVPTTPIMINVPNIASPSGIPSFESDEVEKDVTDLQCQNPQRPTYLYIPEKPHQSGSSTPVSDSIMLAVMLYLQHQNCKNRKYCPCCRMITKQLEKIAREQGQDALDKAIKDIQTPGTEGHKQMLRKRYHTTHSPYRPGLTHSDDLIRHCSSSTSEVHEEELTFSSTETEEDEKFVRKACSSHKVHTDDEMAFFLPLSSINITSKDLASSSSEPDLTTPITLPSSLLYEGVTPSTCISSRMTNTDLHSHRSVSYSSGYESLQSESDSTSNYSPAHNNTLLLPVQSDTEFSDSDSYKKLSPVPGSLKAKRTGLEGRPTFTPHLSDHRAPYPLMQNDVSLHPYHHHCHHQQSGKLGSKYRALHSSANIILPKGSSTSTAL